MVYLHLRQAASNHHKSPLKHRKYAGFGTLCIRKKHHASPTRLGYIERAIAKILAFYQHTNNHHPKLWRWFSVVCGGFWRFACISLVSLPIVPNSGGDLWWFAVICGGVQWFAMVCGDLSYSQPAFLMILQTDSDLNRLSR